MIASLHSVHCFTVFVLRVNTQACSLHMCALLAGLSAI